MNFKKIKIEKDYNRLINILLALYVTLCLIFALLYNGFFIQPKAFTSGNEYTYSTTQTNNGQVAFQGSMTVKSNGRTNAIFFVNDEFKELLENKVMPEYGQSVSVVGIRIRERDQYAGDFEYVRNGSPMSNNFFFLEKDTDLYNYFADKGMIPCHNGDSNGLSYVCDFFIVGTIVHSPTFEEGRTVRFLDDVEYVTNVNDLKAYLQQNDDNVINKGDPFNPKTVVSSNIPTPQKVKILENGENPCVVWDNPKDVKKFGDKINIEIGFKPTFKLYYGLHFADTVACTDYIGAWLGKLGTHNGFCILKNSGATTSNALNGYDMIYDDNYIYDIDPNSDYDKSYIKFAIDQNGNTTLVPFGVGQPPTMTKKLMKGNKKVVGGGDDLASSAWDTLAPEVLSEIKGLFNGGTVGTSDFRIRYTVNDNDKILVSPWVIAKRNFDNDSKATDDTGISFTDKDDNPIQNPTYLPSSSTNVAQPTMVSSDAWWLNFNGYTANLFTNIGQQMSEWTNDSGGFLGFFAELFNEFPFLSWLLLFSMTLALFLRIFGR